MQVTTLSHKFKTILKYSSFLHNSKIQDLKALHFLCTPTRWSTMPLLKAFCCAVCRILSILYTFPAWKQLLETKWDPVIKMCFNQMGYQRRIDNEEQTIAFFFHCSWCGLGNYEKALLFSNNSASVFGIVFIFSLLSFITKDICIKTWYLLKGSSSPST